jgi:hypothetical protein
MGSGISQYFEKTNRMFPLDELAATGPMGGRQQITGTSSSLILSNGLFKYAIHQSNHKSP